MRHVAATLLMLQISVVAAGAQGIAPAPASGSSTVEIVNSAPMNIVFDISCDQGRNWDAMTIAAGVTNTYYCTREAIPPSLWFRIVTQVPGQPRREVQGPLEWKTRSEIAWDEGLERWTLRRVSGPR
jgi:hypothetical protein